MKKLLFALLFLMNTLTLFSQNEKFVNNICLPSKQYLMIGVDNELFIQPFLKRWRPYDDFVRFSGTVAYQKRLEKKAVIKSPKTGDTIRVDLVNGDEFETKKTIKSLVCAGQPKVGTTPISAQFIGDSYTHGAYFKYAMLESGYVPNVSLIGTRALKNFPGQFHEGRGGWTLFQYFSDKPTDECFYNPFWQPKGNYRYWGNTQFWKNCIRVKKDSTIKEFKYIYWCADYDVTPYGNDGRRIAPKEQDLMWDTDLKKYILWSKNKWVTLNEPSIEWQFDYGKYLDMNQFKAPDFLVVMLGLNDFGNKSLQEDFSVWNAHMETILASYKASNPNGKLVVCTPCSSVGVLDNASGDFTTRKNAVMWTVRKNVIENFDNRESEGIYVVDASITIDNENGYRKTPDGIQNGNPHPYPNYPALGIPIAAFIQYFRK